MNSIKTILVHLANDADHMARLKLAYNLARRHQAHVEALYVVSPISLPAGATGRGASANYISEAVQIAREKSAEVEAEFRRWCQEHQVSYSWTASEGEHLALLHEHAHYADLAVVSQTDPSNLEEMLFNELPSHLPMVSSCPTIVLPHSSTDDDIPGERALIAWKGPHQGSRSVRNALPLLSLANTVTALVVEGDEATKDSARRMAAWLSHHGIQVKIEYADRRGRTIAQTILEEVGRCGCDLLVMGGRTRSRLTELMFGSVTEEILKNCRLPMLMSR